MTFNSLFNRYVLGYATALLLLSDLPEVILSSGVGSALYLVRALLDIALIITAILSVTEPNSLINVAFKDAELANLRKSITIPPSVFAFLVLTIGGFSLLDHAYLTVTRMHLASLYFFIWLLADFGTLLLSWRVAGKQIEQLFKEFEK
jgi:type III secretory pathway component EscS